MTLLEEILNQVDVAVKQHNEGVDGKFGSPQKAVTQIIGLLKSDDGPEMGSFVCRYGMTQLFTIYAEDDAIVLHCELTSGGCRAYTREQAEDMLKNNKFYAYANNLLKLKTASSFGEDYLTIKKGEHEIRVRSNTNGAMITYVYNGVIVYDCATFSDPSGLENLTQLINHVNNS